MPIEKSLGLAQKLEECSDILSEYIHQSDSFEQMVHFLQLRKCVEGVRQRHVGDKLVTYAELVFHTK